MHCLLQNEKCSYTSSNPATWRYCKRNGQGCTPPPFAASMFSLISQADRAVAPSRFVTKHRDRYVQDQAGGVRSSWVYSRKWIWFVCTPPFPPHTCGNGNNVDQKFDGNFIGFYAPPKMCARLQQRYKADIDFTEHRAIFQDRYRWQLTG